MTEETVQILFLGDSIEELKNLPDSSIDSIVTDPPYGLSFMGKKWDYDVPSVDLWREALRVLKPGGHLLSFGGTRTYHRMVVAIEDAGFEIRDQIQWLYGSGFPKSLDVSKAMDKAAGAEREVVGTKRVGMAGNEHLNANTRLSYCEADKMQPVTAPATDLAKQWAGWGTALKPANEPIVLARKPLEGTVAKNVETYGTGALNIDASRVEFTSEADRKAAAVHDAGSSGNTALNWNAGEKKESGKEYRLSQGRWPANIILSEAASEALDEQSGTSPSNKRLKKSASAEIIEGQKIFKVSGNTSHDDCGGASRFFYVAKASKRERGEGNVHPTVKPIALMEYLIRLITPPGGTVLDPFMGSGTTGVAAKKLDFHFIGIEREKAYYEIAEQRILKAKSVANG